jgi:transposase
VPDQKLKNRRAFTAEFKAQVVLELLRGEKTLSQMGAKHSIKDTVLSRWKQEFISRAALVFVHSPTEQDARMAKLESALRSQAQELAVLKKAFLLMDLKNESK